MFVATRGSGCIYAGGGGVEQVGQRFVRPVVTGVEKGWVISLQ